MKIIFFHLDKALTEKNYDPEQKEQVLTEMYQELKEKQKAKGRGN